MRPIRETLLALAPEHLTADNLVRLAVGRDCGPRVDVARRELRRLLSEGKVGLGKHLEICPPDQGTGLWP
jgi:hypothetical protein